MTTTRTTVTKTNSKNLPKLDFSKKGLEEIKESELFHGEDKTRNIQLLLFSHNKLTKFQVSPNFVSHFSQLKALHLDGNSIVEVPETIGMLRNLVKLHLEHNKIRIIPRSIGQLQELRKLYLDYNDLYELPEEIGLLGNLEVLRINDNHIQALPSSLSISANLKELSLHNNPLESPPPFIYSKGLIQLQRYMYEVRASLLVDTPREEYIFTRGISFAEGMTKLKRAPSTKSFTMTQSIKLSTKEANKVVQAINKKGTEIFERKLNDESISINQNYLLYFLSECGSFEEQGRRDYMEDRCVAFPRLKQQKATKLLEEVVNLFSKVGYFGVYDGHGGELCAQYLKENLHKNICNTEHFLKGDFEAAIRDGFRRTDNEFLQMCRDEALLDGSTCLVVMIIDNKLIAAHAGDSRAVLCRDKKAIRLTEDHKPDRVDELARIEEAGGEVIYRGNCFRVQGDLAMSRSFGDLRLKEPVQLVLSDPEIRVEELTPKDQFVILASDGLWDVISDQKAVDIVKRCATVEEASRKLVETALALGTMDNTTATVVKLNWNLDFLTNDEIEGKIANHKPKTPTSKREIGSQSPRDTKPDPFAEQKVEEPAESEISEEQLERTRSSSFSFRDNFEEGEGGQEEKNTRKSIYLPVHSEMSAVKLKILIPDLSATKLMKFDTTTKIKDIIRVLILKHRFVGQIEDFILFHKGEHEALDLSLDMEKTIKDCHLKDFDVCELKSNTSNAMTVKPKPAPEPTGAPADEAMPPPELVEISNTLRRNNKVVQESKKNTVTTTSDNVNVNSNSNSGEVPRQLYNEVSAEEAANTPEVAPKVPSNIRSRSVTREDRPLPPVPPARRATTVDGRDIVKPSSEPRRVPPPITIPSPSSTSSSDLRRPSQAPLPPEEMTQSDTPTQENQSISDAPNEPPMAEETQFGSPKEPSPISQDEIPPSPVTPSNAPRSNTRNPSKVGSSDQLSQSNNAKKSDISLIEVIASVFRLENGQWKPLDGGQSRVALLQNTENKYRVIALSQSNQFVINAWMRVDRQYKRVSETFCNFPTVVNRQNVTFGLRMRSADDAAAFTSIFESCYAKLRDSQASTQTSDAPTSQGKQEEGVKLKEFFNL